MFRLPQQVRSTQFTIDCFVGNDQRFCWTSKQVNAHTAKQLTFSFRYKSIARTNNHIHRVNGLCPNGHGTNCLNTAHNINFIGASNIHCHHNRRRRFAIKRRCSSNHPWHTGHFGGHHTHVRTGHQRIFTTGHITTHTVHGHILMTQDHTRQCFHFHILKGIALMLGKIPHLFLGKFYIFNILIADLIIAGLDFFS